VWDNLHQGLKGRRNSGYMCGDYARNGGGRVGSRLGLENGGGKLFRNWKDSRIGTEAMGTGNSSSSEETGSRCVGLSCQACFSELTTS